MKFKILAMLLGMSLFAFSAYATTYTISDDWVNWPGYGYAWQNEDEIGNPQIEKMEVTVNDSGLLTQIDVFIQNRLLFDSLFINSLNVDTGSNWDSWDYLIRDAGQYNSGDIATGAYTVTEGYHYTLAVTGRTENPNGILLDDLTQIDPAPYTLSYDGSILSYDISAMGIDVSDGFYVAYTPYCANDVIGSPVPEPTTLVLLGVGLVGLVCYRKKS